MKPKWLTFLATAESVEQDLKTLQEAGFTVQRDETAGTVEVFRGEACVYRGLWNGKCWIVRGVCEEEAA